MAADYRNAVRAGLLLRLIDAWHQLLPGRCRCYCAVPLFSKGYRLPLVTD